MGNMINIGGRIHNPEVGNVVAGANEILDDTKGKKQNVINQETDAALLNLSQTKQDNLTFDNAPTENSNNPVKSGGVYAADAALQSAIEAILLLIPSAASSLNQLADKAFVNSSISTNTATFRGTYNSVSDLHLAIDATHAQIEAALDSTIATADNNDYCYVQIPVSATSFDIEKTERYKFDGTGWKFEYQLNNSGFTSAQWAAINSGITSALVGDINFIKTVVPAEATALNQLADKAYVIAQILAATPAFKGQFTTLADLQAVASPKAGDLGIVRTKDSDGYDVFTFYQYLNNAWNVFYTLSHHLLRKPASTGTTGDYPYNGMGRVVIPKNMVGGVNTLTQDAFKDGEGNLVENTEFVLQHDFITENQTPQAFASGGSMAVVGSVSFAFVAPTTKSVVINGVTYYYYPIKVPAGRKLTITDTTHCVILDNLESVFSGTEVYTYGDDKTIYIASTAAGSYANAYSVANCYYYTSVSVPQGKCLSLIDTTNCVLLDGTTAVLGKNYYIAESDASVNVGCTIQNLANAYSIKDVITIPANSALTFEGGSLGGDSMLVFQNTLLNGNIKIKSKDIEGTLANSEVAMSWFDVNNYSVILENVSKSVERIYIDKDIVCKEEVKLYCNTYGDGVVRFNTTKNIGTAIMPVGEFDIDQLSIDCSNAHICHQGFWHLKDYYSSRIIRHNVNVWGVTNKYDSCNGTNGITYSHHAGGNTKNPFSLVLKCNILNVCGCANGVTGDNGGAVSGLSLYLGDANSAGGTNFIVEDSYVQNAYYDTEGEDSVAVHIANHYPDSYVQLNKCFFGYGGGRSVKLQGARIILTDCVVDMDSINGVNVAYRGIDCMSQNTTISGCVIKSKLLTNPGEQGGGLVFTNYGDAVVRNTKIDLENGYNHVVFVDNATGDLEVSVSSNAATTDVYSAIYIAASNSKQIKIKAHGNIPNLAFVHKKGYYSADVSLSGVCAYGFRTVANGHCYYLTIHDCQLVCSEFVVFNQYNISLDSINAYNNRFEGKRLIQSGVGTWNNSVFENNVFVCNSNAGNLTAINGNFDIKFINNIIDGNGQDITLIMTNGPLTFLNNVFKTALVGNVISGIYGHYNLVGNVFYIEDGAGFNINMANVFAFGNIDMNKKAMLFADALGNSVGTVYPKVIGTPTSGNLAKFNGTNIEDSGQAPAT